MKLLALQGRRGLHRDQVLEALWPEMAPGAGQNNLRQNLHRLRGGLAEAGMEQPVVESRRELLGLSSAVQIDTERFQALANRARGIIQQPTLYQEALSLYVGELLPNDRYEEWTSARREELRALHGELLMEFADLQDLLGNAQEAAAQLEELVREDPLHEEAQRRLIRQYALSGRREMALRQYKSLGSALRSELGVEPAPETERLMEDVIAGKVRRQTRHAPPLTVSPDDDMPDPHSWTEGEASQYRQLEAVAVPARDEQIATIVSLLPFTTESSFRVLEIGCGEGALGYAILDRFPGASILALDGSESMRMRAGKSFLRFGSRAQLQPFELGQDDWLPLIDSVDAVVSSLVIHHLADGDKLGLFRDVHARLDEPGAFLIADLVDVQRLEQRMMYADIYDEIARTQSIKSTGSDGLFRKWVDLQWNFFRHRSLPSDEHAAPLFDQLTWLQAAGFAVVDCYWFRAGFAVFGGYKTQIRPTTANVSYIDALASAQAALSEIERTE